MPQNEFANRLILVVDDEERMVRFIRLNLEHDGFRVIEAYRGEPVLELVRTQLPDLVLLDVMLPDLDGFEVLRMLREVSNVPVIMLTAKGEEADRVRGLELGADDYVTKPFSPRELVSRVRAIEAVGRGEALLDPAVTQRIFQEVRKAAKDVEASAFSPLTQQEKHVLLLVSEGKTNREIAKELFLGEGTVRNYVSSILSKLNVSNRAEAAAYAVQHNLRDHL